MIIEKVLPARIPMAIQIRDAILAATGQNISESRIVVTHTPGVSVEVRIDKKEVPTALKKAVKIAAEKILG